MELHQLRYFVAAAEAGTISRAAQRCSIAQPSLSQQLKKLEESLGVQLLDRLGRGIALTEAGRALLPRARRILAEVRDTEANLQREVSEGIGGVAVGAIPTMAPYLLPPVIKRLRDEMPACEVTIREARTEELIELLVENQIDCAVMSTPVSHEMLEMEVLGEEELLLVVAKVHALGREARAGWGEIREEPTVTLSEMHCLGRQIEGFCSARRAAQRVTCRTTQLGTIFELVALGMGVSIVPEMAAAAVGTDRWRYARLSRPAPAREIAAVWRKDRSRTKGAERLMGMIAEDLAAGRHGLNGGMGAE
jgi:LysR family transcriptional regulator, hydrogen peroxide-inducible genes activator